jgi:hypothetical protein
LHHWHLQHPQWLLHVLDYLHCSMLR